jgi:hypothetical protein
MTITAEFASAAVLPSAWKSIILKVTGGIIVSHLFTGVVHAPIQFTDGSLETISLRDFRHYATHVILPKLILPLVV